MRAIVCTEFGPSSHLILKEFADRPLNKGEVRITVRAAGVNFADALKVEGRYQVRPDLPWIPGVEIGGEVVEVAANVCSVSPGDKVMGVCGERGGGFSDTIILSADRVFRLSESLCLEHVAVLPVVYGTALYALRQKARLQPAETVLVLGGAGGVGLAAIEVGRALGAEVIAAASTVEKRDLCLRHGAAHAIDYTQAGWHTLVRSICSSGRIDVVFDPVGGAAFEEAERCVGWGARYLVIGFAGGDIPSLPMNKPLVKGYDVCGVRFDNWRDQNWPLARENYDRLLAWYESGDLKPSISTRYPLHRTTEAIQSLAKRDVSGKVIVVNTGAPVG